MEWYEDVVRRTPYGPAARLTVYRCGCEVVEDYLTGRKEHEPCADPAHRFGDGDYAALAAPR